MLEQIIAIYTDGGVIGRNPSAVGGSWAWCAVDAEGNRIIERGGVVEAPPGRVITNNHTEYFAATLALEAMPEGWSGTLYSDSQITIGRLLWGWRCENLPVKAVERSRAALARLGRVEAVLLQGHPTKADLACGMGKKRNLPVSTHNVWADAECNRQAKAYIQRASTEAA